MAPISALTADMRLAEALLEIGEALAAEGELSPRLDRVCLIAARVLATDTCSVYLLSEEKPQWLVLTATYGLSRAEELGVRGFAMGEGVPGWSAAHDETVQLRDSRFDQRYASLDDTKDEQAYVAYLCTPLRVEGKVIGVLSARRRTPCDWTREESIFAEFIAREVSVMIDRARLVREKVEAERLAAVAISLNGVAHYIKNILQGMSGGAFFVEAGLRKRDFDKANSGWQLLKRNMEKIGGLVENMLMYSREKHCELEVGDLNALVARVAQEVDASMERRGIRFHVQMDHLIPYIMMDEDALQDALLNLITNAMDAIPADRPGEIRLTCRLDLARHVARVEVSDNGAGISPEAQQRMFNLFFTTKGRGGTGIGLAVTRRIMDEHGGTIDFETEQDKGTTFLLEFPLSNAGV